MTDVVVVSPLTSEAILGVDFLQKEHASIDLSDTRLHLKERGCDILLRAPASLPERGDSHLVQSTATVEVPPHSTLQIMGKVEAPVEGVWLLEESMTKNPSVAVARALVEPVNGSLPICVLNHTEEPITLYSGMVLATLEGPSSWDQSCDWPRECTGCRR